MSAFDQTATCAWCLQAISRAGRTRAPWQAGTDATCRTRSDGKYYHEPLEPGASPHTVCRCEASAVAGVLDPTHCGLHDRPWTP